MTKVWVLREDFGPYEGTKLLGVYSTEAKALEAAATRTWGYDGAPYPLKTSDTRLKEVELDDIELTT